MKLKIKLDRILLERNMTQKELAELTGLREATISEFVNDIRSSINKRHLLIIMKALEIKELDRLIELEEEGE